MATPLGWLVIASATVALRGPADGLAVDPAAADRDDPETQQRQGEPRRRLRDFLDAVDHKNPYHKNAYHDVDGLARTLARLRAGSATKGQNELDEGIKKWLDESNKAGRRLQSFVEEQLTRIKAFRATKPRRRHFRKAPRASRRQRAKIAKEMAEWLPGAMDQDRAVNEEINSVDKELLGQLLNISNGMDSDDTPSLAKTENELRTLQAIWDKYGLTNENTTAVDILEKLYPSSGTWFGDVVHRLRSLNETESHEIAVKLREEVERLKVELGHVRSALRAEEALLEAEEAERNQAAASVSNEHVPQPNRAA